MGYLEKAMLGMSLNKKKPKTLETLTVALLILRAIPRGRKVTAKDLQAILSAQGIQRDLRSVQRMVRKLAKQFDIQCDRREKPFGYSWGAQAPALVLPHLSRQESLLLSLAREQLKNLLPHRVLIAMSGLFEQAKSNLLPKPDTQLERQWLQKVRVVSEMQPLLPPSIRAGVMDAVTEALYSNRWLSVDYENRLNERKQGLVMPLGLVQQGPRLYLVCQFEGYSNQRILAVHRLQAASVTPTHFDRPDFDLAAYEADGQLAVANGPRIQLKFELETAAAKHLLESRLSEDQTVEDLGSHQRFTATVNQTLLLDRWLNSFGAQVRNIEKSGIDT